MGRLDAPSQPAAVEIPLPWGPVLRGVRLGSGPDAVLLLHEPGADLDAWGALPSRLAQALGVAAVAVDLPGHGLSDDPWEPEKADELVRLLVEWLAETSGPALTPLPPPRGRPAPIAMGERESSLTGCSVYVISAGSIATAVHAHAGRLTLAGMVTLSPTAFPPSPIAMGEGGRGARANVPKLFFAGSLASDDLETARRLAFGSAGWAAVTSVPISEQGTRLLATPWRTRIEEEITAFLRDCQRRRPGYRGRPGMAPQGPD